MNSGGKREGRPATFCRFPDALCPLFPQRQPTGVFRLSPRSKTTIYRPFREAEAAGSRCACPNSAFVQLCDGKGLNRHLLRTPASDVDQAADGEASAASLSTLRRFSRAGTVFVNAVDFK
ncbi:MAG: hypothetical protein LBP50_01245 [Tannerella sp.]|nr:hypothetical protein [Tannerella sp.]